MGAFVASRFSPDLTKVAMLQFGSDEKVTYIICFILIFLVCALVMALVGSLITKLFKIATLGWLNRLLGALFAAFTTALVLGLLISAFDGLNSSWNFVDPASLENLKVYHLLRDFSGVTHRPAELHPEGHTLVLHEAQPEPFTYYINLLPEVHIGLHQVFHDLVDNHQQNPEGNQLLSGLLRSETAIQANILIMRAFVSMRHFLFAMPKYFRGWTGWSINNWRPTIRLLYYSVNWRRVLYFRSKVSSSTAKFMMRMNS